MERTVAAIVQSFIGRGSAFPQTPSDSTRFRPARSATRNSVNFLRHVITCANASMRLQAQRPRPATMPRHSLLRRPAVVAQLARTLGFGTPHFLRPPHASPHPTRRAAAATRDQFIAVRQPVPSRLLRELLPAGQSPDEAPCVLDQVHPVQPQGEPGRDRGATVGGLLRRRNLVDHRDQAVRTTFTVFLLRRRAQRSNRRRRARRTQAPGFRAAASAPLVLGPRL